jgi:phosphopantothenoylcysteine decarboxylase / phosphopantothenate---cysteine ligase
MNKKRVLLIVGGGISAYKTPEIVRQLDKQGIGARVILTAAGGQFVSPLTLASLTHRPYRIVRPHERGENGPY